MRHLLKWGLILFLLGITFPTPAQAGAGEGATAISPQQAQRIIAARSRNAVAALRDRHMARLSTYVHPTRGLRFSPYVSLFDADLRFSRRGVRNLGRTQRRYNWGDFDGSGEPIRMTWREYYTRFVYARDFARAPQVNYNVLSPRGNTINRLAEFYPAAIIVEYHFPAPDGEMNWRSLWLVWQKRGATWYLSAIANDEWTI